METDQERVRIAKNLFTSEEIIKTNLSFKKGIIAGLLILALVLCVGILIGYSIGANIATDHYSKLLLECQDQNVFKIINITTF